MATTERAQWHWTFTDRGGATPDRPISPVFTNRFDAEAWLGEHWRGLAADRVADAQLLCDDEPVGPRVALREA